MNKTFIEFVNHASVLITYEKIGILSDPWYKGTAFHDGWRLVYELDNNKINELLNKTSHIYISHEHPDHFRPEFFSNENNKNIIQSKNIEFLFQNTKDKRVINFLKNLNFNVHELKSNEIMKLKYGIEVQIEKYGFYDSFFKLKTPDLKILNLNDCGIKDQNELNLFQKKHGNFDVLLTQFSYAAWKGGINNKNFRKHAAEEKLKAVENQTKILNCKSTIPFASFVYFSNELNNYMNDSINTPENVKKFFIEKNIKMIFLRPGEIQDINNLKQDQLSLDFWKEKYNDVLTKSAEQKDKYKESVSYEDLTLQFQKYKSKILSKNSKFLIFILCKIKILNFFQPIKIKLLDHNSIYNYSIFKGLKKNSENSYYDIQMHSQSLSFIFKNEFGFDTLTVNGCFEANQKGFIKSSKNLAIGNLNAMGFGLNFGLIFQPNFIFLFLNLIRKVSKKLSI